MNMKNLSSSRERDKRSDIFAISTKESFVTLSIEFTLCHITLYANLSYWVYCETCKRTPSARLPRPMLWSSSACQQAQKSNAHFNGDIALQLTKMQAIINRLYSQLYNAIYLHPFNNSTRTPTFISYILLEKSRP